MYKEKFLGTIFCNYIIKPLGNILHTRLSAMTEAHSPTLLDHVTFMDFYCQKHLI